jgi:hypothetical protein
MAVSSQTVVIVVRVVGGNSAQLLQQLGIHTNTASTAARRATSAYAGLGSVLTTMTKALLSMFAVLVAFNVFITLPQQIMFGMVALVKVAITAASEMQRATIAIAGLLLTFGDFGDTSREGFETAYKAAERLNMKFVELSAQSLASAEDIQQGFQFFVSRGGMSMVKTLEEGAKATQMLVDLTLLYAGTANKARQIQTEIPAVIEGQARAGATVARLIKGVVGDMGEWVKRTRENKDLLNELNRIFPGMAKASAELAKTPQGLLNTIVGMATYLDTLAMKHGAFKDIVNVLTVVRDSLSKLMGELGNTPDKLSSASQKILDMFTQLSAAVQIITRVVSALFLSVTSSSTPMEGFYKVIVFTARAVVLLAGALEGLAKSFMNLSAPVRAARAMLGGDAAGAFKIVEDFITQSKSGDYGMRTLNKRLKEFDDAVVLIDKDIKKGLAGDIADFMSKLMNPPKDEASQHRIDDLLLRLKEMAALSETWNRTDLQNQIKLNFEREKTLADLKKMEATTKEVAQATAYLNTVQRMSKVPELAKNAAAVTDAWMKMFEESTKRNDANLSRFIGDLDSGSAAMEKLLDLIHGQIKKTGPINEAEDNIVRLREELDALLGSMGAAGKGHFADTINALFGEWAATERNMAPIKQLILDATELGNEVGTAINKVRDAQGEFNNLAASGNLTAESFRNVNDALKEMNDFLPEIDAMIALLQSQLNVANEDLRIKLTEQIEMLQRVRAQVTNTKKEYFDLFNYLQSASSRMQRTMTDFYNGTITGTKMLTSVGQEAAEMFAGQLGGAITQMFSNLKEGESALAPFKKLLGSILIMTGEMAVSMGTMALLGGLIPAYQAAFPTGVAIAFIAAGTAAIAAGVALGGAGGGGGSKASSTAGNTSGSGGDNIIYLEPHFQRNNLLLDRVNATLTSLDGTIGSFQTKSPGVIVKEGLPAAKQQVTQTVISGVQGSDRDRRALTGVVLGTAAY